MNVSCWPSTVGFSWQEGDVLVIDNMLVAHSGSPFTGPRKIVVALGDMTGGTVPQWSAL